MPKMGRIGVFDSGFGGLNTLRHLRERLPAYDYAYLGDSARAPYGPRMRDEVYQFGKQAVDFLFAQECELVVFACNTASSDALRKIQQEYLPIKYPGKRVLGVSIPLSEMAASTTVNKKIGILATEGTVRSGVFMRELHKLDPVIEVFQEASPLLVPLIERGLHQSAEARTLLEAYLRPLIDANIDTLILGCTHYGFLIGVVRAIVGPAITVVSEVGAVPPALESYLVRHADLEAALSRGGTADFYTTDTTGRFDELGSAFFGSSIHAQAIVLG
jgi:glutamate racemase